MLLSYAYCGECHVCKSGIPSHCTKFHEINFMGGPVFKDSNGISVGGRFFGQSSFAKHTIASEKSVVNVKGMGLTRDDLKLLAPFGCGLQTGSGTVTNVAKAGEEDAITIIGMGGVGLAAVMVCLAFLNFPKSAAESAVLISFITRRRRRTRNARLLLESTGSSPGLSLQKPSGRHTSLIRQTFRSISL